VQQEWRVSIALKGIPLAERKQLESALAALSAHLGDHAGISADSSTRIFVYTDAAEPAAAIVQAARDVLAQHDMASAEWVRTDVWLPTEERWGDAAEVPPAQIARSYEYARKYREAKEKADSVFTGNPAWRVTVTARSGREATAVREYLVSGGWRMRAGRRRLVAWADCEDEARALTATLTGAGLVGTGTRIQVERQAYFEASSSRGFSLFDFLDFLPPRS
jgi:hypothetical protein